MEDKRELLLAALNNNEVSRIPVGFWWHFVNKHDEFTALSDPTVIERNIEGTKKLYDELNPDFVKLMSDGFFGHPFIMENDIKDIDDIRRIKSIGDTHEWYDAQISMVNEMVNYFNNDRMSFYSIFSPLNYIRLYLINYKNEPDLFVRLFLEDPEAMYNASMEIAKDIITLVHKLKSETNIDGIFYSVQSLQSKSKGKDFHDKYVSPSDKTVLEEINRNWDNNLLHICGYGQYTNDLTYYKDYKAKAYNWAIYTEDVSLSEGKKLFNDACIIGGFDNSLGSVLDIGTKNEVDGIIKSVIDEVGKKGLIIGADCTIPLEVGHRRYNLVRDLARI